MPPTGFHVWAVVPFPINSLLSVCGFGVTRQPPASATIPSLPAAMSSPSLQTLSLWKCKPKYVLSSLSFICKGILSQNKEVTKTVTIHYFLSPINSPIHSLIHHLSIKLLIHSSIIIKYPSIPPSSSTCSHHPFHPSFINLPPTCPSWIYYYPFIIYPAIHLLIYAYSTFPSTHLSIYPSVSTNPSATHTSIIHSIHHSFIFHPPSSIYQSTHH